MRHSLRPSAAAFTLIELLTVIAIIGILAAIIIPTVGTVRDKAQRAVDANNLREITKAAQIFAGDNNDRLPDPTQAPATLVTGSTAVFRWPGILAKNGILTDPSFYFSKNDPQYPAAGLPDAIIDPAVAARNRLSANFINKTMSWEFVGGLKMSDPATTPVAFTRGLQTNGSWNITSGVYKDTGGYISFLGGNVAFYSSTATPAPLFTNNNSGRKTADVRQAIPFNATAALTGRIYATPPPGGATVGGTGGTVATRGQ